MAPRHLLKTTQKWWKSVVEGWQVQDHHIKLLTLAAESWDRSTLARRIVERDGLLSQDRYGQPRLHPAAEEERRAKTLFANLIKQLNLDVEDPGVEEERKRITGSKYWKGR